MYHIPYSIGLGSYLVVLWHIRYVLDLATSYQDTNTERVVFILQTTADTKRIWVVPLHEKKHNAKRIVPPAA